MGQKQSSESLLARNAVEQLRPFTTNLEFATKKDQLQDVDFVDLANALTCCQIAEEISKSNSKEIDPSKFHGSIVRVAFASRGKKLSFVVGETDDGSRYLAFANPIKTSDEGDGKKSKDWVYWYSNAFLKQIDPTGESIHEGIYEASKKNIPYEFLEAIIKHETTYKLVLCGHGMSGSLAATGAIELQLKYSNMIEARKVSVLCVTFGSAFITNNTFANYIGKINKKIVSFKHVLLEGDPIPLIVYLLQIAISTKRGSNNITEIFDGCINKITKFLRNISPMCFYGAMNGSPEYKETIEACYQIIIEYQKSHRQPIDQYCAFGTLIVLPSMETIQKAGNQSSNPNDTSEFVMKPWKATKEDAQRLLGWISLYQQIQQLNESTVKNHRIERYAASLFHNWNIPGKWELSDFLCPKIDEIKIVLSDKIHISIRGSNLVLWSSISSDIFPNRVTREHQGECNTDRVVEFALPNINNKNPDDLYNHSIVIETPFGSSSYTIHKETVIEICNISPREMHFATKDPDEILSFMILTIALEHNQNQKVPKETAQMTRRMIYMLDLLLSFTRIDSLLWNLTNVLPKDRDERGKILEKLGIMLSNTPAIKDYQAATKAELKLLKHLISLSPTKPNCPVFPVIGHPEPQWLKIFADPNSYYQCGEQLPTECINEKNESYMFQSIFQHVLSALDPKKESGGHTLIDLVKLKEQMKMSLVLFNVLYHGPDYFCINQGVAHFLQWLPVRLFYIPAYPFLLVSIPTINFIKHKLSTKKNVGQSVEEMIPYLDQATLPDGDWNSILDWLTFNTSRWELKKTYTEKLSMLLQLMEEVSVGPVCFREKKIWNFVKKSKLHTKSVKSVDNQITEIAKCTDPVKLKQYDQSLVRFANNVHFFWESSRHALIRLLLSVYVLHEFRVTLSKRFVIGIIGNARIGKSYLINKIWGFNTNYGSNIKENRTLTIRSFSVPNLKHVNVLDFPGSNEPSHSIAGMFKDGIGLLNVAVVVLPLSESFLKQAVDVLVEAAQQHIPCLVCLNKADCILLDQLYRGDSKEDVIRSFKSHIDDTKSEINQQVLAELKRLSSRNLNSGSPFFGGDNHNTKLSPAPFEIAVTSFDPTPSPLINQELLKSANIWGVNEVEIWINTHIDKYRESHVTHHRAPSDLLDIDPNPCT